MYSFVIFIIYIAYEGEGRGGYRDQIVTCDVGVSLHSKIHPLFMKYSNGRSTQCHAHQYPSLFPVLFLQLLYVPFHILVSTLFLLVFMFITRSFLANLKLNARSVGQCTQYINVLTCDLASWVRKLYTG